MMDDGPVVFWMKRGHLCGHTSGLSLDKRLLGTVLAVLEWLCVQKMMIDLTFC